MLLFDELRERCLSIDVLSGDTSDTLLCSSRQPRQEDKSLKKKRPNSYFIYSKCIGYSTVLFYWKYISDTQTTSMLISFTFLHLFAGVCKSPKWSDESLLKEKQLADEFPESEMLSLWPFGVFTDEGTCPKPWWIGLSLSWLIFNTEELVCIEGGVHISFPESYSFETSFWQLPWFSVVTKRPGADWEIWKHKRVLT